MDLPRFFLPPDHIAADRVTLTGDALAHAQRVLRLGPGDRIYVLDGRGTLFHVTLTELGKREGTGHITATETATGELPAPVTLAQALIKGDRFEWAIQKATELGVARIVPLVTERTVVRVPSDRLEERLARWTAIAREAAEQCERARVPEIVPPCSLERWLATETAGLFACLERAEAPHLRRALAGRSGAIAIAVGPEGGFTPREGDALLGAGAVAISLGARILRAETAGIAAVTLAAATLEDAS